MLYVCEKHHLWQCLHHAKGSSLHFSLYISLSLIKTTRNKQKKMKEIYEEKEYSCAGIIGGLSYTTYMNTNNHNLSLDVKSQRYTTKNNTKIIFFLSLFSYFFFFFALLFSVHTTIFYSISRLLFLYFLGFLVAFCTRSGFFFLLFHTHNKKKLSRIYTKDTNAKTQFYKSYLFLIVHLYMQKIGISR